MTTSVRTASEDRLRDEHARIRERWVDELPAGLPAADVAELCRVLECATIKEEPR